jgi:site-specific recombinase XerD
VFDKEPRKSPALSLTRFMHQRLRKCVYSHLPRRSTATILLDSGEVPLDQVQKFLGHLQISTMQIYAEISIRALGESYLHALNGGKP